MVIGSLEIRPEVVFAILVILLGIINLVLWLFILRAEKTDKQRTSQEVNIDEIKDELSQTEERLVNLISRLKSAPVDLKPVVDILDEIKEKEGSSLDQKNIEEVKKKISEVKNFVESIDAHIVDLINQFKNK